jgi:hypothetical protein
MSRATLARSFWLATACVVALAPVASANYQVRGRFLYRDRPFGLGGFTGLTADLPIREAEVDVIDASNAVLATGVTDGNGDVTINVIDSTVRDVRVRCKTIAPAASTFEVRVLQTGTSNIFAVVSPTYTGHDPNTDIDFTSAPVVALPSDIAAPSMLRAGDPFNIYDNALDAIDFVTSLRGSRPSQLLTIYWNVGSAIGTYYSDADRGIRLLGLTSDSDGYDDAVILHEIGHYIEFTVTASDNPGGNHSLNGLYDLRLAWSEGWATFFQNMVRDWKGQGRPEIYVDTSGQPGSGHAFISYEVETPSVGVPTARNEVSVNAVLWDIVDGAATPDGSAGTDDDGIGLADGDGEAWQTVSSSGFRNATSISLEDFWDAWFAEGNGMAAQMQQSFNVRGIEYNDDPLEPDDGVAQAQSVLAGSNATHHTIYGAGDEDWIVVAVQGGSPYVFETLNLTNGADTQLHLYASDGTTLISTHDDRVGGMPPVDPSSIINYTSPQTTVVYLRARRKPDTHTYGSYDLRVTGTGVPVEVSAVHVTSVDGGVQLTWQAHRSGAFSHFEIERRSTAEDAWIGLGRADAPPGADAAWEYLDRSVEAGVTYEYRIVGVEATGEREAFGPFTVAVAAPARLALRAPQPNPFNPTTLLAFDVPASGRVWLRVFSVGGAHVRTLVGGENLTAGRHQRVWDGRDESGHGVASGVYVVRVDAGAAHAVQRAVLVR